MAIRCVSEGCYMFFIDDFTYIPATGSVALELKGYNVYRNGEQLNDEPVAEAAYVDTTVPEGTHSYVVTALYDKGESLPSAAFVTDVTGLESIGAATNAVKVSGADGVILVEGAEGLAVSAYAADGKTIFTGVCSEAALRIVAAPGAYVVKVGNAPFKVIVR